MCVYMSSRHQRMALDILLHHSPFYSLEVGTLTRPKFTALTRGGCLASFRIYLSPLPVLEIQALMAIPSFYVCACDLNSGLTLLGKLWVSKGLCLKK